MKGTLDPTLRQSTEHMGILEMQRNIPGKENNPQGKCPSASFTLNNTKKFLEVRSIGDNNTHVWFNNHGISKGAIATKAIFAVFFICTIASTMAIREPSPFFPRVQYHKV